MKEDDPVSTDGKNRWQEGIDSWIKENHSAADSQWYPPSELTGSNSNNIPDTPTPNVTATPTPSPTPGPTATPTPSPTP